MNPNTLRRTSQRPTPPQTLSKETVGVWAGWCNIGDKEVAREAAAKGSHIKLAITFLSLRRNVSYESADDWFKSEVIQWVSELLERKQIFKVSHIYTNIGLNPPAELIKVFCATGDRGLREAIAAHLIKIDCLSENLRDLWAFLNLILENVVLILKYKLPQDSIECLDQQTDEWKAEIATILFLKLKDNRLVNFLQAEILWKHLLANNDRESLLLWINLRYKSNLEEIPAGNLVDLFRKFPIHSEMIDIVGESTDLADEIYNEFSKFGIFSHREQSNVLVILKRLNNSCSIANLNQILSKPSSVISLDSFIKLLINYCLENNLLYILNSATANFHINSENSQELEILCDFRKLVSNNFNEVSLKENIFNLSNVLSNGDIAEYFNKHPIIFISLIFFAKNIDFIELITKETRPTINGTYFFSDYLPNLLENLPILKAICHNRVAGRHPECILQLYDLLDRHLSVNSGELFKFRFTNTDMPNFNSAEIVENYGYCKIIDYKFYLTQSRPSSAAKHFILNQMELYGTVKEDELRKIEKKVQKLAISHFQNDEITSTCISFLEIINRDSTKLRIIIKSASILMQAGFTTATILEILQNCDDEPYQLQNHLETILMERIEAVSLKKGDQFLKVLKTYEIIVQYSKLSNIKLPELFLKHCAASNLWLPFLLFAQIHNYPTDQLKLLIQFFKSPNMLEHLTHGVLTDIQPESEKNVSMRKNFLARVGVRKSIDEVLLMAQNNPSVTSQSSYSSGGSVYSSDFFEIDISNIKATLLQTLIRCHNSTDPPRALVQACQLYRNPLLAVLATSYEPDSVVTNWLTWLAVSCCLCQTFTNFESRAVSANCAANLVVDSMKNRYPKALLESFQIFLPENPLKIFIDFLNDLIRFELKSVQLVEKLAAFQASLKSTRKNSVFSETDHEMTYLTNRVWIENVALRLLAAVIGHNCDSLHDQIVLVDFLHEIKLWKYTSEEDAEDSCPNFSNLSNILKALTKTNVIPLDICAYFDEKDRRQAVINCITSLLEKHQYDTALEIAQIENLPPDLILVKEWQNRINYKTDASFWHQCDAVFAKFNVTADCVVEFYMEHADKIVETLEKFTVLKMAWLWASSCDLSCQYEIEMKMWLSFLCLDEKNKNLDVMFTPEAKIFSYKDLCVLLKNVCVYEGSELSKDFVAQLERIVNFALNRCNFWMALRLQKIFNIKSADLETLKLSHSLAEGILLPYQLNAEQRLLLSNVNRLRSSYGNRRTFLSTRLSSFSSSSHSPANVSFAQTPDTTAVETVSNDTLAILKVLSEYLHNGIVIGQTIFMMFRISINIEIPYQVVTVAADHMKILKDSLEDDCMNKLDVVHDFIFVYKWTKPAIADFICDELISAISNHLEDQQHRLDQCLMWDLNITNDFQLVLQLLQENCSLLGHKLYSYLNTLHKSQIESGSSVLNFGLIIELLIKAHDCFTADCNMEGISLVLKKSKEVVANLLTLQDWKSIVRLATGVGRYTEMNYVFQILKENDQFEFLLRKGLRKDNTLKVALLEYLKKFCPDNRDLYKIVALHFTLFSEVAVLWEKEAENVIKNLITISQLEMQNNKVDVEDEPYTLFQNTESTQICLKKAMENYKHATDFHLQGEKLTKAMESAKQAELIALQLGRLNQIPVKASTICLLNLSSTQIAAIVLSKLSFEECLRLVEAYNFHPDWSSILHEQYIVKNNIEFFDAFLQHLPLTDTLANDISRKFIHSNNNTNSINEIRAVKNILSHLPSVHTKYRIASELGFTDLVEDLIASGQLIYLKDTVWKKGYKS